MIKKSLVALCLGLISTSSIAVPIAVAADAKSTNRVLPDLTIGCDLAIAGGGLSGTATAYEGLLAGKTVCMTEITDWVGGQITAQGVSALDERPTQRTKLYFPRGYLEFRQKVQDFYGKLNSGYCWVSEVCFIPKDGDKILYGMLKSAESKGKGKLYWYPNTVVKELIVRNRGTGKQINAVVAIQHQPQPGTAPLNTEPLSQTIDDTYSDSDSAKFKKQKIIFIPTYKTPNQQATQPADWYVVDATETGELIGLADVPYRLGLDPRSSDEPSAATTTGDPYCTQGFTYPFAMETTETPRLQVQPVFYQQYAPYYSYELKRLADFGVVYTYRRIYSSGTGKPSKFGGINYTAPTPGDISMQNWTWGNDYRPGSAADNLILDRSQLQTSGQLQPGGWMGGLRTDTLRKGEEHAQGFYYWLVAGSTDSQANPDPQSPDYWVKTPNPNQRYLSGLDSPMGTVHGLSKYPYIREGRRIIGRPSYGYKDGFTIAEVDISRNNLLDRAKMPELSAAANRRLEASLSGVNALDVLTGAKVTPRNRATIYADTVGIGHYAIDFHPCMQNSPPEAPNNRERDGARQGGGQAYPFQIPLRAMIPQKIDNMLVAGKSIATSHVAAAAYRVHSFEWSAGAAAGTTITYALEKGITPAQMVEDLPNRSPSIIELRKRLEASNNPTSFPNTSIFNNNWQEWK
ncbi:FAD-dependent oxidoreductase [Chamaesiphon sp.]|uniref:FAD-dependent oxidoreductase n=1 Tax=Chamaesiphon sp. TaxID=2814140 RepID=UPI00359338D6